MISPMLRPSSSYCERWRQVGRALTAVARDRSGTDHTFGRVTELASRLANAPREG